MIFSLPLQVLLGFKGLKRGCYISRYSFRMLIISSYDALGFGYSLGWVFKPMSGKCKGLLFVILHALGFFRVNLFDALGEFTSHWHPRTLWELIECPRQAASGYLKCLDNSASNIGSPRWDLFRSHSVYNSLKMLNEVSAVAELLQLRLNFEQCSCSCFCFLCKYFKHRDHYLLSEAE